MKALSWAKRAVVCGALLSSSLGASCEKNPQPAAKPPEPPFVPEVLAWVLPYENSIQSFGRNARFITIASPTYFRLNVTGKEAKLEDWDPNVPFPRAKLTAAISGPPAPAPASASASASATSSASSRPSTSASAPLVMPLVGCIGPCGPKISRVIDDEAARRAHVADLLKAAREQNLQGLVIDYEDVDAAEPNVSRFVDELAQGLHGAGKKLVLVIQEPCGVDPACKRNPFPFALKTLVKKVDHLAIMEYDYVVDGTGAPAPRAWVEKGMRRVVSDLGGGADAASAADLRKVLCAVPFYGRVTKGVADDTAVLFDEVKSGPAGGAGTIRTSKATLGPLTMDANALSKTAAITNAGKDGKLTGTLYLEDKDTLAARVALLTPLKIGGIAIWRLGGEDPCMSTELAKLRQLPAPTCP